MKGKESEMKKHRTMIFHMAVIGLAWLATAFCPAYAQNVVILPVDASGNPIQNAPVTISVLTASGVDLTDNPDSWLLHPGDTVRLRVNAASEASGVALGSVAGVGTSQYPGVCTNFDDPQLSSGLDVSAPDLLGNNLYQLTPRDTRARAVVTMTVDGSPYTFVVPPDTNLDGIPDFYAVKYCGSADCLAPNADIDTGPEAESPIGDGITNIDEFGGFRVAGQYIRGDPLKKDFFVHFVEPPQCIGTLKDASGSDITLATFFANDYTEFFTYMDTLSPEIHIHFIGSDEWVDHFVAYTEADQVILAGDQDQNAVTDRQINQYAIGSSGVVKGVRLIECLDLVKYSPLGWSGSIRSPDGIGRNDGNAVIFTQRIWKSYRDRFALGEGRDLQYYTFENGSWIEMQLPGSGAPPSNPNLPFEQFFSNEDVQTIMKRAYAFYGVHEAAGHNLDLTPTQEGTNKNPVGYHHVAGTGTNIDIKVVQKIDKKTSGYNKFYIPKYFGAADRRDMRLVETQ
jgi:hypothetical protein